ncbi:hypothetical protein CDD82_4126 [Ophiocordyceps australis]|uniref:MARVEL domain-containing protein n=1 Tax=Ophiocordyceps australis TaxID=1399860 RepID=A0A2C5Z8M3_9HYPO|nr:hypothetical protein CDD82_4126 [Ophiocordyceps australis]
MGLARGGLRMLASANHFLIFLSALIVTGILSYFLHKFPHGNTHNTHLIFQEVVAVITFVIYLVGMVLPFMDNYHGHMVPLNLILSYLWLTSFIFSAQDWSGHRCRSTYPAAGLCGRKHTVEAFNFLAFFFLLANVLTEGLIWRARRTDGIVSKNHHHTTSTTGPPVV